MSNHRVLHVFYSFLPDVSGSSIRSLGVISGLRTAGVHVAAISSPFQPGFQPGSVEQYEGVTIYRTFKAGNPRISEGGASLSARLRKLALFPRFASAVLQAARAEGADVIHAHSTFYCAFAALIAGRLLGKKVVYESRSVWEERARNRSLTYRIQSAIASRLERIALRSVDHAVAINSGLKEHLVRQGAPADRVTVVPNAVEDTVIAEARLSPSTKSVARFGYVGSLSPIEGLDLLLRSFVQAFPADQSVTLTFYGSGIAEDSLRSLASSLGDGRIRFAGKFGRTELSSVYNALDCVVIPRTKSRLTDTVTPLKPLEAMAFGKLVIASNVGGLQDVIGSSDHALFFEAGNSESLADALIHASSASADATRIAHQGRTFVQTHRAWSSVARRYLSVYRTG